MIIYAREKEVLKAQKRSLSAWINNTLGATVVNADNLLEKLSTGVILCRLANCIQQKVDDVLKCYPKTESQSKLKYWESAKRETFFARDNAEIFIRWCKSLGVREAVLFESDGLVLRSQPRCVLLCLSEVSRLASKFGVLLPPPIQLSTTQATLDDDDSEFSDDEFLFASTKSPSLLGLCPARYHRWDSGCSSGGARSPSWSSSSPTHLKSVPSSPCSTLKRSPPAPLAKKEDKEESNEVVIVVRSSGSTLNVSTPTTARKAADQSPSVKEQRKKVQVSRKTSPRLSSPSLRQNCPLVRSDTISSRLKSTSPSILSRSASSLASTRVNWKSNSKDDLKIGPFNKRYKLSPLDKQVFDVARKLHKDENQIHRISEGHYNFGHKNVFLRIVRGNNVVVRLGGGWDTLEHYMSTVDFTKWESLQKREKLARKRHTYCCRNLSPYMTL